MSLSIKPNKMKQEEKEQLAAEAYPYMINPITIEDVDGNYENGISRKAYIKGIEKGLGLMASATITKGKFKLNLDDDPQEKDYTKEKSFWKTLESFVKNVQVGDPMSEEEKEMILRQCELKTKERGTKLKQHIRDSRIKN